jgi:signal transduction histidine kinase
MGSGTPQMPSEPVTIPHMGFLSRMPDASPRMRASGSGTPAWLPRIRRTAYVLALSLMGGAPVPATAVDVVQPVITAISVDDGSLPPARWSDAGSDPDHPLELGECRSLRITCLPEPKGSSPSRLRYRLEGVDGEWHESVARMRLTAQIVDPYQMPCASRSVIMAGESPGWDGHLESAPLIAYELRLRVPARGRRCDLSFSSEDAGGSLIGWGAISGVTVTVQPRNGSPPKVTFLERRPDPPVWVQVRTSAWWMAKPILRNEGGISLGLLDERDDAFASWRLQDRFQPAVEPGDEVVISWKACHSLGYGGARNLEFGPLKPGAYLLRTGRRSASGQILPGELKVVIRILPPWWQRPLWWAIIATIATVAAILATRAITRRRWKRQLAAAERRTAVEQERARIARDLHDELGTNLAQISMLGSLARSTAADLAPGLAQQLDRILARAGEGSRKLREIVWAVNPTNDAVEPLALFLCAQAEEHLQLAGVRLRIEIPEELPPQPVSSSVRHHLVLAVREALHNAVRHGRPSCVILRMGVQAGQLVVELVDDGVGCDPAAAVAAGRGVAQMQDRFRALGGACQMTSTTGNGTSVRFSIPCRPD